MDGRQHSSNLARAISRSREARALMRRRRRRAIVVAVGGAALVTTPLAMWASRLAGADIAGAVGASEQNLLELLDQRSPGARTQAALTKTKRERAATAARPAALVSRASLPISPLASPALADLLVRTPAPPAPIGGLFAALQSVPLPGSPGVVTNTPGSSGGGGSGTISPGPSDSVASLPPGEGREPLRDTPAVPEPQTWALMLVGFALVGWRIRRRPSGAATHDPGALARG